MINNKYSLIRFFLGKGIIDKRLHFLLTIYKRLNYIFEKGEVKLSIPGVGIFICSKSDSGVGLYLRTRNQFEPLQTKLLKSKLKQGSVVVDVGANIGYYTVLSAKNVGIKGKIISIEADPENIKYLNNNIRLNKISKKVILVQKVVGEKHGFGLFKNDKYCPSESFLDKTANNNKSEIFPFDQIVAPLKVRRIDLIKVDIEGAEIAFLKGAKRIFKINSGIELFIECNPKTLKRFNETWITLVKTIQDSGFTIKTIINEIGGTCYEFTEKKLKEVLSNQTYVSLYAIN